MFNKTVDNSGKQALMRIEDLEARLNMEFSKASDTTVVLVGNPSVSLDDGVVVLGKMSSRGGKISMILKYTGGASIELLVDNKVAIADDSKLGIAFGSIDIEKNTDITISAKGSGVLETFELHMTGDTIVVDSTAIFSADYSDGVGVVAMAQGGGVYVMPVGSIHSSQFTVHNSGKILQNLASVRSNTVGKSQFLMAGTFCDVCVEVVDDSNLVYVLVVDVVKNLWLVSLDAECNVLDTKYLSTGVDSASLCCNGGVMYVASVVGGKVSVSRVVDGYLCGKSTIDYDRVSTASWVKQSVAQTLILSLKDKRNIVLNSISPVRNECVVEVSGEFVF